MANLIAFLSGFLSYLLVFFVFVAAIAVAVFIGITVRKIVNKKQVTVTETANGEEGESEA